MSGSALSSTTENMQRKQQQRDGRYAYSSDAGNLFWSFFLFMWWKPIARNSLPHSVYHYWDVRPPAQGCHPLVLIDNYLMDLGRAEWIWREVCCKDLEVPMKVF